MNILVDYRGAKYSVDVVVNDKLVKLLNCVPSHMKNLSYKERFLDTIDYIVGAYSYLLPKHEEFNNYMFAEYIKQHYSLENGRNNYVYEFLMAI